MASQLKKMMIQKTTEIFIDEIENVILKDDHLLRPKH